MSNMFQQSQVNRAQSRGCTVVHTFAGVTIPEHAFGVGVAFDLVDRRGSPHAVDAASGEGVRQGAGGLERLCLVQLLPGEFRGRMVKRFAADAGR